MLVVLLGLGCSEAPVGDLAWRLDPKVPMFAFVTWKQRAPGPVTVEFSFDEGEWHAAPTVDGGRGEHEQIVVGIPMGMSAEWRLVTDAGTFPGPSRIETSPAPARLPLPTVAAADPAAWLPEGRYLLTSISEVGGGWSTSGPFWTVILDRQGRPVWATRTERGEWTLYPQVSVTGDHLIHDVFGYFSGGERAIRRYLDELIEEIPMPGFHHAFVELPDGTLAWGSTVHGGAEALVEKAPGETDETVIWTCRDDWPEALDGYDFCRSNSVYYDAPSDRYVYSFYSHEAVVMVDRATGATRWWAGGVPGGFAFVPPESQFFWQHGVTITPQGTLLVSSHDAYGYGASTNLAIEYAIDETARTLTEVWSYDARAYADTNGDLWRLPNGNTLHTLGSASQIKEVSPTGEPVWHLRFAGDRLLGRSEWISDLYTLVHPRWSAED